MSDPSVTEFAAESHPGNRYQHNEDSLGWSEDAGVWLVADGMGGHACGDVASRTAKQAVLSALAAQKTPAATPITKLISDAHDSVVAEGIRRSAENMGSTIVVVRVQGATAEVGWCGDSRVYLWRDKELIRLTRDHSLLEQLLESGVVEPSEAFGHPQKHVLVQALGITNPPPVPARIEVELASNDMLLLCSDGLHDEIRDEEINALLIAHPEPSAAAAALVQQVLAGPARDNVSVVCIRVGDVHASEPPLTVAQLRERFERLPKRRVPSADSDTVTPVHTPAAKAAALNVAVAPKTMAAPKIALPVNSEKPSFASNFSRGQLFASAAIGIFWAIALLWWLLW